MISENKNEKDIKIFNNARKSNPDSQFLGNIKSNDSFLKESHIMIKKEYSIKDDKSRDENRSKSSSGKKIIHEKKFKKKSLSIKNKKREREKILKMLKNEKLKIPTGKRMSAGNKKINININNIEKKINSLPKNKNLYERLDKFGNKISKENKKNVHITFLDNIPYGNNKLIEIIPIESFKKLNMIEKFTKENYISYCSNCCQMI